MNGVELIRMENPYPYKLQCQIKKLNDICTSSPLIKGILEGAQDLGMPEYYIGAGCITQTVWNNLFGKPFDYGIKDIDLVYFDSKDIGFDAESQVIQNVQNHFKAVGIKFDVKNQARVHKWYQEKFGYTIEPYRSLDDAISSWPTTATAVGIRLRRSNELTVCAPFGLDDLFHGIVRANKKQITKDIFEQKVCSWYEKWPQLTIIDWENT